MKNISINLSDAVPHVRLSHFTEWNPNKIYDTVIAYDCRLLYIVQGECVVNINNIIYRASSGCLFMFKYGNAYSVSATGTQNAKIMMLNFDFTSDNAAVAPFIPVAAIEYNPENICGKTIFKDTDIFEKIIFLKNASNMYTCLLEIYDELQSNRINSTRIADLKFGALVLDIARTVQFSSLSSKSSNIGADSIAAYILSHFSEELSDETIGKIFHYHPNYIRKLIFGYTGMPTHKYLSECRLVKALELLIETELPVKSICMSVGFKDFTHFSKAFKKKYGKNPSAYRR